MINVLLVHENKLMLNMVSSALEEDPDISIISRLTRIEDAMTAVDQEPIDIIMISSGLPEEGANQLLKKIAQHDNDLDLVLLGVTETRQEILQYIEAGATAYVTKDSSIQDMLDAIHKTYQGQVETPPRITAALIDRLSEYARIFSDLKMGAVDRARLTDREMNVLELLAKDMTNYEIADELVIEVGTVKNHVHSILTKLNVESRDEAANYLLLIQR